MRRGNIQLHIDELVLHGFASVDRHRIAHALEHELQRLLTEQGTPCALRSGGEVAHLHGGSFEVSPNGRPERIGVQVAQAVYKGLSS